MTNQQQTGWLVAAIIIGAIIIASMVSKASSEPESEPAAYVPFPEQTVSVQEQQALDCIAAGNTWTGYSCDWFDTP